MEFEKNAPVSDDQRRLAETKKITLQPVHDVTPDDISDSEIANSHINGQPIGNIHTDIEQDAPTLRQADSTIHEDTSENRKQSAVMVATVAGVSSVLIIASLIFVYNIIA